MKQLNNLKSANRSMVIIGLLALSATVLVSCAKEESVDLEAPIIHLEMDESFPKSCAVVFAGAPFTLNMHVSDNVELGSFSLSVHHRFDHHAHSTEDEHCAESPEKEAVNPWQINEIIEIPAGSTSYTIKKQIQVPASIDTGDYHLMIRLTDQHGWQTVKGMSIRIE